MLVGPTVLGMQGTGTGQPTQHPRQVSPLLVPIIKSVLYSTCIRDFSMECYISSLAYLISHIFLASSNFNLFICSREWCNGWIALQVFIRGPSSKADVRGGYTTPRPTLFMLVTPQKHRPTLHHLPYEHLINKKMCFILSKYFYCSKCNLNPKMFSNVWWVCLSCVDLWTWLFQNDHCGCGSGSGTWLNSVYPTVY